MSFTNRRDAGRQLARLLKSQGWGPESVVLGLPRGGVPVAYEVARALGAPLDVMVARKLGAPHHPEFGIGAVAPGGILVLDEGAMRAVGATRGEVDQVMHDELQEMERRLVLYRGEPRLPDVRGKAVILVDDGLATGVTARAALRALRALGPERLVLAVPVCAPDSADALRGECDLIVCVESHEDFRAVGLWYDDFSQTEDEEVLALLEAAGGGEIPEPCPARIPLAQGAWLEGELTIPRRARALVVFAHGSGSGRHSPRNRQVARRFQESGLGTLLLDLLTPEEAAEDARRGHLRFDVQLLARRLVAALDWLGTQAATRDLAWGVFGSSTGAAAALLAAAHRPGEVGAVVSRGGRPDLARDAMPQVEAATLFLVGERDEEVLALHEDVVPLLRAEKDLAIIPGATHLFEEPDALEEVARLAAGWFVLHLAPAPPPERRGERVRGRR